MGDSDIPLRDLLKQMMEQQRLLVDIVSKMAVPAAPAASNQESTFDRLYRRIDRFVFDPDQDDCFELWYNRYKDAFDNDCSALDEKTKTRLLVSLLDATSHSRFARHILPKEPAELDWSETLDTLKVLFGTKKSLFRRRFECLKMSFSPNDDMNSFVNLLKARSLDADFKDIKPETLECLALVFAMQGPELADFRVRFLRKLDEDDKVTVDELAKDYYAWKSAKEDSKFIESAVPAGIRAVRSQKNPLASRHAGSPPPPYPCPICSDNHWKKNCPLKPRTASRNQTIALLRTRHADVFRPGLGRCSKSRASLCLNSAETQISTLNSVMEDQFNRHHGPHRRPKRTSVNQLIPRALPTTSPDKMTAFDMPFAVAAAPAAPKADTPVPADAPFTSAAVPSEQSTTPRRSRRHRRQPTTLKIDPRAKSYRREINLKGEVLGPSPYTHSGD